MVTVTFYRHITFEEYINIQARAIYILKKVKKKYPFTKFRERITCNRLIKAIEKDGCYMGIPWATMDEFIVADDIKPAEGDAVENGHVILTNFHNRIEDFFVRHYMCIKLNKEETYDINLKSINHPTLYTTTRLRNFMCVWPENHEIRKFLVLNHIIERDTRWNFISGDFIVIDPGEKETQNPETLFTLTKIIDRVEGKNCRPD